MSYELSSHGSPDCSDSRAEGTSSLSPDEELEGDFTPSASDGRAEGSSSHLDSLLLIIYEHCYNHYTKYTLQNACTYKLKFKHTSELIKDAAWSKYGKRIIVMTSVNNTCGWPFSIENRLVW